MSLPSRVVRGVTISSPGPVPPTLTQRFFDYIFDSLEYDRWKKSVPSRLLRLVGGPGSGKTSFAALAVKSLQDIDQSHHCHQKSPLVLSVFFKPLDTSDTTAALHQEQNAIPFAVQFLAEIEKQLDDNLQINSEFSPPPSPQTQIDETAIFNNIRFKLFRFSDIWLVVDDLDCLWCTRKEYREVEERLEQLRSLGIRVLITSRTPFKLRDNKAYCDVKLEDEFKEGGHRHDDEHDCGGLVTWWECDLDDHGNDGPFYICQNCNKAGFGCGNLSHPPPELTANPLPVMFDINNAPEPSMKALILHNLQLEHGQFWPLEPPMMSEKEEYPPVSCLGRRLLSSNTPGEPSREASDLVDRLVQLSNGNPSIALCILEIVHQAESLDAVMDKKDRLPKTVVEMFDRLVGSQIQARVVDKELPREMRTRAALALHAIQIVGQAEDSFFGVDFETLREMLLEDSGRCARYGYEELLEGDEAVDEVMGAAGGLLAVRSGDGNYDVTCFHPDFYKYVNERYNEFLTGGGL
ncbi:hypothetical protein QBC36DRAFT_304897 [Triangularia setosa]|uniref:Nephrocystin 3-like N-terminal domain-containing protein n=1 Tax=Triangularia setosa TaxID=2587417 RepID=A0AAN7A1K4_9PEZI|nr:hypothetical protein QBC36DRAFT_304897 [Podospora setosa]